LSTGTTLPYLYILFIDSEKAFVSIDRDQIWIELNNYEMPPKIIKLIQESYKDACQDMQNRRLSSLIETGTGANEGLSSHQPFSFL
jgi:hypothetical protein